MLTGTIRSVTAVLHSPGRSCMNTLQVDTSGVEENVDIDSVGDEEVRSPFAATVATCARAQCAPSSRAGLACSLAPRQQPRRGLGLDVMASVKRYEAVAGGTRGTQNRTGV